jgi:hypothetical protein
MVKTTVKNNKTNIPKELSEIMANIKVTDWHIKKNDKIELEFEKNDECETFANKLEEIRQDMKTGKREKLDVDALAKEYGI